MQICSDHTAIELEVIICFMLNCTTKILQKLTSLKVIETYYAAQLTVWLASRSFVNSSVLISLVYTLIYSNILLFFAFIYHTYVYKMFKLCNAKEEKIANKIQTIQHLRIKNVIMISNYSIIITIDCARWDLNQRLHHYGPC